MSQEAKVENNTEKQGFFSKWGNAIKDFSKNALGDTRRKQVGTGVTTIGGVGIAKNILAIFGIGEFDLTESALALVTTLVGLGIRLNPKNIMGIDSGDLADAPSINLMELTDEQATAVADKLGVSLAVFYEAAEFSQMEPEPLEKAIRAKYGDLLDRYAGKKSGGLSSKERALVTCIQHFARLNELVGQGKVVVTS